MHLMYVLYYSYIYTLGADLRCGPYSLIVLSSLASLSCMGLINTFLMHLSYYETTILTSLSFNESPHTFCGLLLESVQILCLHVLESHFHTQWYIDYKYHGSAPKWWSYGVLLHGCNMLSGFGMELFLSPWLSGCLMLDLCVFLFPDTGYNGHTWAHIFCHVTFFLGVCYMHMVVLCACIVAILDCADTKQPIIITTFHAL